MIPFNKPHLTGKEMHYMYQAVYSGKISGNGMYTKKCQNFFEEKYGFKKALLTTSCTDALEMCALLADIKPGDEVIMPSYTFVSTANAFVREGAKIVFADSRKDHPGIDEDNIEELITDQTKAIVVVHYAGVACDMDKIMSVANKHSLLVIEDAAHAIDSYYKQQPLGSIGHLATFSFHETKNVNAGEGGMLMVNDERFIDRSEIIWEKGTNRAEFFRGEVNKYEWVDIGSSFLPSEITAAYLWAQLEELDRIQKKRKNVWQRYQEELKNWADKNNVKQPFIPEYATNNGHIYYLVFENESQRSHVIKKMKEKDILTVFHYLSLHKSEYYKDIHNGGELPQSDRYTECLLRLPLFVDLGLENQTKIINELVNLDVK